MLELQHLSIQWEMWLGNGNCSLKPHHHHHVIVAMAMDLHALVSGKVTPIRFAMPRATFSALSHWIRNRIWSPALSFSDATPPPPVRALRCRRVRECRSAQLGWGQYTSTIDRVMGGPDLIMCTTSTWVRVVHPI
jgi:hypothetical protein